MHVILARNENKLRSNFISELDQDFKNILSILRKMPNRNIESANALGGYSEFGAAEVAFINQLFRLKTGRSHTFATIGEIDVVNRTTFSTELVHDSPTADFVIWMST